MSPCCDQIFAVETGICPLKRRRRRIGIPDGQRWGVQPENYFRGLWGIAEISNGVFRSSDWQVFVLPAPVNGGRGKIIENDYSLFLEEGWEIVQIAEGKFSLIKK